MIPSIYQATMLRSSRVCLQKHFFADHIECKQAGNAQIGLETYIPRSNRHRKKNVYHPVESVCLGSSVARPDPLRTDVRDGFYLWTVYWTVYLIRQGRLCQDQIF